MFRAKIAESSDIAQAINQNMQIAVRYDSQIESYPDKMEKLIRLWQKNSLSIKEGAQLCPQELSKVIDSYKKESAELLQKHNNKFEEKIKDSKTEFKDFAAMVKYYSKETEEFIQIYKRDLPEFCNSYNYAALQLCNKYESCMYDMAQAKKANLQAS